MMSTKRLEFLIGTLHPDCEEKTRLSCSNRAPSTPLACTLTAPRPLLVGSRVWNDVNYAPSFRGVRALKVVMMEHF